MYNTQITSLTPVKVNVQNQVKLWISKDGLPQKHQARFIRLRAMNPIANIYLIVVKRYLTPSAKRELYAFANRVNLTVIDYYSIPINENDPAEVNIKFCLDREIKYFFDKTCVELVFKK